MVYAEEVLRWYQENDADLKIYDFQEKPREVPGIKLSYTSVKLA